MTTVDETAAPARTKALTVLAACPQDCPDTCSMVVTVEDGVATRVAGNKDMPFTDGGLCVKVNRYLDKVYDPDQLLYPMRRTGPKGSGQYAHIHLGGSGG